MASREGQETQGTQGSIATRRKLLSIENIKDFQSWNLDLMEAWAAMYLPIVDYQSTVNHLIVNRLDSDIQAASNP